MVLNGLLQDCKHILSCHCHICARGDISLNICAFDGPAQVHLDVCPVLDLCGRSSMGVNLQSARLIWESSRDVTHEELEPRERWLVMTPGIGFLGQLVEHVEDDKQRPLGRLDLRD